MNKIGLPGATRSGSVDPSARFHFSSKARKGEESNHPVDKQFHLTEAESILNHNSGFKGLCGTSNFSEIVKLIYNNNNNNNNNTANGEKTNSSISEERARLTFDIFVDRIIKYVGSYFVELEGNISAI